MRLPPMCPQREREVKQRLRNNENLTMKISDNGCAAVIYSGKNIDESHRQLNDWQVDALLPCYTLTFMKIEVKNIFPFTLLCEWFTEKMIFSAIAFLSAWYDLNNHNDRCTINVPINTTSTITEPRFSPYI